MSKIVFGLTCLPLRVVKVLGEEVMGVVAVAAVGVEVVVAQTVGAITGWLPVVSVIMEAVARGQDHCSGNGSGRGRGKCSGGGRGRGSGHSIGKDTHAKIIVQELLRV